MKLVAGRRGLLTVGFGKAEKLRVKFRGRTGPNKITKVRRTVLMQFKSLFKKCSSSEFYFLMFRMHLFRCQPMTALLVMFTSALIFIKQLPSQPSLTVLICRIDTDALLSTLVFLSQLRIHINIILFHCQSANQYLFCINLDYYKYIS